MAKEPVTIRLDVECKARLAELALADGRTVSSEIDIAVREYLDRRLGSAPPQLAVDRIRVRHASLPDTSILSAFHMLAPEACEKARQDLNLPPFEFLGDPPEWSRLRADLLSGESDLVESVNWSAIFWHTRRGISQRLDWTGPFLHLFGAHCVFIRRDLAKAFLSEEQISEFVKFRDAANSGKELSLRSLVAWARQTKDSAVIEALDAMWAEAVVGCQLGTDYHIAIRRLTAALAYLAVKSDVVDPPTPGVGNLDQGFREFCNGTVTAFTGNVLHSADLFTRRKGLALLIAGPADVRVPSLNTLAARKEMFAQGIDGTDRTAIGGRILEFWGRAVGWFHADVINAESDDALRSFIVKAFPESPFLKPAGADTDGSSSLEERVAVLKSLMQTWMRWFEDPEEARAFLGDGGVATAVAAEDLVEHYQELCMMLNPSAQMAAPGDAERQFWRFPTLPEQGMARRLAPAQHGGATRETKTPKTRRRKTE